MLVSVETATAANGALGHGDVELGISKVLAVPKAVAELQPLDQEAANGGKALRSEALSNRQTAAFTIADEEEDESAGLLQGSQVSQQRDEELNMHVGVSRAALPSALCPPLTCC